MFFPRMFSCQVASQVTALSCCTDPHACPGYGHLGTGTPSPMLIVTCVSMVGRIHGGFCGQLVFCRPTRALAQSHAGWSMYHLRRHRPFLHFSHERVLPAPSKQARRLNHGVPDLLQVVVQFQFVPTVSFFFVFSSRSGKRCAHRRNNNFGASSSLSLSFVTNTRF